MDLQEPSARTLLVVSVKAPVNRFIFETQARYTLYGGN
ncbi:hypothetical protein ACP4OV_020280 [Aristida adscensionis]